MTVARRILEQLETEFQRVENQLRGTGTGPTPSDGPAAPEDGARVGDFHDQALASEAKEMAYETRERLLNCFSTSLPRTRMMMRSPVTVLRSECKLVTGIPTISSTSFSS